MFLVIEHETQVDLKEDASSPSLVPHAQLCLLDSLPQWLPTSLMLQPFNMAPHVLVPLQPYYWVCYFITVTLLLSCIIV